MREGILIAGYYGAGNTGDEAILSGMLTALRAEGIEEITVISRNPEETANLHGVRSTYCGRRQEGVREIFRCLRRSRLFVLGGGGLLQDHTARVVPYWLSRVGLSFAAGTPVMYYAQGIGPLRTKKARGLVRCLSNKVEHITVRDEESRQLLQEIGVDRVPVEVTADPALGIRIYSDGRDLLNKAGVTLSEDKLKIAVCLRSWHGEEEYLPVLIRALRGLRRQYPVQYLFFPFQYGCDEQISHRVLEALGAEGDPMAAGDCIVPGRHSPEQVAAMLKEMDGVIAMRLHAVILGSLSCVPAFGLIYDPKVECFMKRAGLEDRFMAVDEIAGNEENLLSGLCQWLSDLNELSKAMQPKIEEMVSLTRRNAQIVKQLLNSS